MERNALERLTEWNESPRRKPLIVWGARKVGKTFLIRDLFAERFYPSSHVYIDCKTEDGVRDFCSQTANAKKIVEYLQLFSGQKIDARALLVFDEVQECPNLISALKYFCQDYPDVPVIAAGALTGVAIQRQIRKRGRGGGEPFLFPVGKINEISLWPMSFDEFLKACNGMLYHAVEEAYQDPRQSSLRSMRSRWTTSAGI